MNSRIFPQDPQLQTNAHLSLPGSHRHQRVVLIVAVEGGKQHRFTLNLPLKINRPRASGNQAIASTQNNSFTPQYLWREAWIKAHQGHYPQAIDLITQLIQIEPDNAIYYNNRGLFHFHNRQPEQSLADYNQALQLNPQLTEAYNNRANLYAYQGQLHQALANYDQAIDLNPLNSRAWINRGITYRNLKHYQLALDQFEFAYRLGRLHGHIFAERGRTYHCLGDWNRAVGDYQRALAVLSATDSTQFHPEQRQRQRVKAWLNELFQQLIPSPKS